MTRAVDEIVVRSASDEDAAPLAAFAERVFRVTYERHNTAENMRAYIGEHFTEPAFAALIGDPAVRVLLVERAERPLGYAVLADGDPPGVGTVGPGVELTRFYLDPALHGSGAAQHLMTHVGAHAADRGAATIWLGVWERNARAVAFYRRCGFAERGELDFVLGNERQTDHLMCLDVAPAAGPSDADRAFLAAFETCTLPAADWTHAAHIRMAWCCLVGDPYEAALERIRGGIRRYNAEVLDKLAEYHETVTVAFSRLIASRAPRGADWTRFAALNRDLFARDKPALERYYSSRRLFSETARRRFVEPDRLSLPAPR